MNDDPKVVTPEELKKLTVMPGDRIKVEGGFVSFSADFTCHRCGFSARVSWSGEDVTWMCCKKNKIYKNIDGYIVIDAEPKHVDTER